LGTDAVAGVRRLKTEEALTLTGMDPGVLK
jgi:hypothetical protein